MILKLIKKIEGLVYDEKSLWENKFIREFNTGFRIYSKQVWTANQIFTSPSSPESNRCL